MEQRTPEWFSARAGRVTASRIADVMAKTKSGYGASRANYMADLIVERLTGQPAASFINPAMQHGIDTEPVAKAVYGFYRDVDVNDIGFVPHPRLVWSGASPDGLVGGDGLVEIKCPSSTTHIDTLLNGTIARRYLLQMQWQMVCTERAWCDFVSFDPRLPAPLTLWCRRVARDDALIAEIESEVATFLAELQDKADRLAAIRDWPVLRELRE